MHVLSAYFLYLNSLKETSNKHNFIISGKKRKMLEDTVIEHMRMWKLFLEKIFIIQQNGVNPPIEIQWNSQACISKESLMSGTKPNKKTEKHKRKHFISNPILKCLWWTEILQAFEGKVGRSLNIDVIQIGINILKGQHLESRKVWVQP